MLAGSSSPSFVPYPALLFIILQFPLAWSLAWPNWLLAAVALAWQVDHSPRGRNTLDRLLTHPRLLYRAHLVLRLPVDDLVHILGLEVPSAPSIYLLAVAQDSVALHWKPTDPRHATVKYLVRVNGIQVGGEQPATVTAVTINNLPSGLLYGIRVVAVNSANFQASSDALYVRTLAASAADASAADVATTTQTADGQSARTPTVTVLRGFTEALTNGPSVPMIREPSNNNLHAKRRVSNDRRASPTIHAQDGQRRRISGAEAEVSSKEDVKQLTDRLDSLQHEIRDLVQQDQAEEEEFEARKDALNEERDALRAQLKEKEEGSKDLKKSVTSLERANTAAQSKKSAQERLLQQKLQERQKMKDDLLQWEDEVIAMQREAEELVQLQKELAQKTTLQIEEIRKEQDPDLDKIKELEDKIRDRGTQVKELEEVRRGLDDSSPDSEPVDQKSVEDEATYHQTMRNLQLKYNQAWTELNQAQIHYQQAQGRLSMLQSRRGSQSNFPITHNGDFPPEFVPAASAAGDTPHVTYSMPARGASTTAEPVYNSNFTPGFGRNNHTSHSRSTTNFHHVPRTSSPFFNASNLGPVQPTRPFENMSQADMESLTGGALASPGASNLLPSDLLGDDPYDSIASRFSPPRRVDSDRSHQSRASSTAPGSSQHPRTGETGTRAAFLPPLPGLGALPGTNAMGSAQNLQADPASPASQQSDSPHSFFASPHGSTSNFHTHKLSEGTVDSDRRSLHSIGSSSLAARPSGRFSSFFSRQRGKTTSEDGPELGTLRSSKTQSMPRTTDWDASESPLPLPGPRKGVSGSLLGQVGNSLLGRRDRLSNRATEMSISGPLDGRPANSNIWAFQPVDASGSRPSSVYSENVLPRPEAEGRLFGGWSSTDVVNRSNSMRTGHIPLNPWSSSRRASVQADNPNQLQGEEDLSDAEYDPEDATSPPQAPIGTRPSKRTRAPPPTSLNPAARDFRSLFKKKGKAPAIDDGGADENSRTSQDIQNTPSVAGSAEDEASMRGGEASQPSTPAETPSTPQPMSTNRDSSMRKMFRKGSSTKFNLGSISGRDKSASSTASSFFSRRGTNAPAGTEIDSANATTDDDGGSVALGRSLESLPGTPLAPESGSKESKRSSGFSLSSFGKSKKGKRLNDAPSISETSMTSASAGAATDEDDGIASERVSVDDFAER